MQSSPGCGCDKNQGWDELSAPPLLPGYFILVGDDTLICPRYQLALMRWDLGCPGWQEKESWLWADLRGDGDLPEHSQNTLNIPFNQAGKELPPRLPVVMESWKDLGWERPESSPSSIPASSTIPGCSRLSPGLEHFQLLPTGAPHPSFTSLLPPSLHLNNSRGKLCLLPFQLQQREIRKSSS